MVPSPQDYLLEAALYEEFEVDDQGARWNAVWIEFFTGRLDCHCVHCGTASVLSGNAALPSVSRNPMYYDAPASERELGPVYAEAVLPTGEANTVADTNVEEYAVRDRVFRTTLSCTRCQADALVVVTRVAGGRLSKIGQYPSRADLELPRLAKYRRILGKERHEELVRGVGLASHGVGIGSFVYLRRVFEHLVDEAAQRAANDSATWDASEFETFRMAERIKALEDHLPPFLVEHRALYGDLSDGLHNRTEEECLAWFQPILLAIEVILDQRLEDEDRARKERNARAAIRSMRGPDA